MLVRRIRSRGANIVVEAHGEVLFAPGGDISRFKNRFSQRVRAATIAAAPTNKRPRWGHYGKPLKETVTASTTTRITKGGGRFYIAVGSTSPHAYYVDQGTGIYNGGSSYVAKVLPPWERGDPSLYEHTWRPGGPGTRRVSPVMIKGQRGQGFFDEGLKRGFQSMRLRSYQVPGEGISGLAGAAATFPEGLANFAGNTAATPGFIAELEKWREWRDAAWVRRDELNRSRFDAVSAEQHAKSQKKPTAKKPEQHKPKRPPKPHGPTPSEIKAQYLQAIRREREALIKQVADKYHGKRTEVGIRRRHDGVYAYLVKVTHNGKTIEFWITSDYQVAISI